MNRQGGHYQAQRAILARLAETDRHRRLMPEAGLDFSSNDYLGLASSFGLAEALARALARGVPVGSGGSRLLRGNRTEHEALEAEAANFFGSEEALYLPSGYAANSALLATLPQTNDLVVHDSLIHASAHEGMRLGRARTAAARHNDPEAFAQAIREFRAAGGDGTIWIVVESLYSMDGDRAPLSQMKALADANDAILIVDEAHATGVFGQGGRGLAAGLAGRDNLITLVTCGKALGCEGALVCASRPVRDFLINRARGFIFSTAPSPLMAAAVRASLAIVGSEAGDGMRADLWQRVRHAEAVLGPLGARIVGSQILPVIIGRDRPTMELASVLQAQGLDVRGIRPPTVPRDTSRLRVSITRNVSVDDIDRLGNALASLLAKQSEFVDA